MKNDLQGVYIGQVTDNYGMRSAIDKQLTENPLYLSATGLDGDTCAELRFHGGVERAVHHYPAEHYAYWQQQYGKSYAWQAAGMGENISTLGMTEKTVCLGDRYQWGEAIIEVSQPRSPCFKLNKRWGIADFSQVMQASHRCGWLYRVLQTGEVSIKAPLQLLERQSNAMTLQEVCAIYFDDPLNPKGLERLAAQSRLSKSWHDKVLKRQATQQVEDWQPRLTGIFK